MDDQIDITLRIVCSTCHTEKPLRHGPKHNGNELFTLCEHAMLEMRIDPDEFTLCPTCGNPLRLRIQAQPYELVHHVRPGRALG
jgi:hypothetical protein